MCDIFRPFCVFALQSRQEGEIVKLVFEGGETVVGVGVERVERGRQGEAGSRTCMCVFIHIYL